MDKLFGPQRATSVRTLPKGHDLGFVFSGGEKLPPTGDIPSLLPFFHRQASVCGYGPAVSRGARPDPGVRFRNQSRPHRIQFRVAQRFPKVWRIKRAGIIPSLPHMTARCMFRIPISSISSVGMLESFRQSIGLMGNDHQMNVIGHQTVADHRDIMRFEVFPKQAQIHFSICGAVQDELPRISALRHMMRNFRGYDPGESCHAFHPPDEGLPPKMRDLRPELTHQQDTLAKGRQGISATKLAQRNENEKLVGERGFEPPTPWSRTRCSTRLSHSPTGWLVPTHLDFTVRDIAAQTSDPNLGGKLQMQTAIDVG
jgi:hypothetical protein